ncbi:hypothetical protein Moror_16898 [Moniliophthora roreri MCA 2997]|uniref:Uncharacterized protein n=2 Tax=Moniliophthora roreri TaxID=221103 RepID=V2XB63_MONRO|nr:hypothetical protein Moror_16898 [Moniliophthora roreri MCA 2997]KAI3620935.1 hypothetical protein WG66_006277 [Moniliophthora roreri]
MSLTGMNIPIPDAETLQSQEGRQSHSLTVLQSEESSYRNICDDALKTLENALQNKDLDSNVREKLEPLFASIKTQKDNLISIISQAQEVQDGINENKPEPDEIQKQVQALVDEFTKTAKELSQQVDSLGRLMAVHRIPTE